MAQDRKNQRPNQNQNQNSNQNSNFQSGSQSPRSNTPQRQGRQNAKSQQDDQQAGTLQEQILGAVTPAFQEVRSYVEGSPVRAAAIGAVAGGLLMTLFSTEKGRAFVRVAYDYANPMVAKYAREYISKAAGDMAESAIAH